MFTQEGTPALRTGLDNYIIRFIYHELQSRSNLTSTVQEVRKLPFESYQYLTLRISESWRDLEDPRFFSVLQRWKDICLTVTFLQYARV